MRVSALRRGTIAMLDVAREDGRPFLTTVITGQEVVLLRALSSDEVLLQVDGEVCSVSATDPKNRRLLAEITERNLPRLCWVAGVRPRSGPATHLHVQVHEFS